MELHSLTSQPHYKTHAHQFLGICQPVVRPVNLQSELLTVFKIIIIIIRIITIIIIGIIKTITIVVLITVTVIMITLRC